MFSFKSIYFVIFTLVLCKTQAEISDQRLCIDEKCSELIAVGKTLIRYSSPEENVLPFSINEDVKVFSYGAGKRPELIGVEIKGKRGYINKAHIRETQLLKRPQLLVNTELVTNKPEVPLSGTPSDIKADPTQQPFEIVDGTKIPLDLSDFSTEIPVLNNVDERSDAKVTKSLDSVPESQKSTPSTEPSTENTKEVKSEEIKVESQPEEENDDDDDADLEDEDEEIDDDDEDEDENEETNEKKIEAKSFKVDGTLPASSDNVPITSEIKETAENITDNVSNIIPDVPSKENTKTQPEIKETLASTESTQANEPINISNKIENETITKNQHELNIDSANTIPNSDPLNLNDTKSSPSLNEPSTIPAEPPAASMPDAEALKSNANEFVSITNKPSDVPVESQFVTGTIVSSSPTTKEEPSINNESIPVDIAGAESKESQLIEEHKESPPVILDPSLPTPSTESPIEIEVPYPELDAVTPNPFEGNSDKPTLSEDSPKYDLPSNLMPEFKDLEESAEVKVEEPASGGILGGLGGIFPMFNAGNDRDDSLNANSSEEDKTHVPESVSINNDNNVKSDGNNDVYFEDNTEKAIPVSSENNIVNPEDESKENVETIENESSGGILSGITSFFSSSSADEGSNNAVEEVSDPSAKDLAANILDTSKAETNENSNPHNSWFAESISEQVEKKVEVCDSISEKCPQIAKAGFCDKENEDCPERQHESSSHQREQLSKQFSSENLQDVFIEAFSSDMFLYLVTTSLSVLVLIFVWILLDKCRREGPLIARINKLEQQLLATSKENEMLQEKATLFAEEKTQLVVETVPNEVVDELNAKLAEMAEEKLALEEQIVALEKELDTSTEVGTELNKIISEMLNSTDGSEILRENVEQMKKKILEQQDTINTLNEIMNVRETENHELKLELEISNKKIADLQEEVNKLVDKLLKIEEERDQQHRTLESDIAIYQNKCKEALNQEHVLNSEINALKQKVAELQRQTDIKTKEYSTLKETVKTIKSVKNDKDAIQSFLDVSEVKAELAQLKSENLKYSEQLSQARENNIAYTSQVQKLLQEVTELREKYEKADKEKVEINTKLQVLNNYFKEKEDQMQKEISKYESLWAVKEGEATSTTERIRYMQEELQNYKAQNESLKQEIVNQEVELKSQISMLEKKSHENWVTNRQTERKLEEAKQEAALLRNRLTIRERALTEGNNQIRMQSPLHQNGELPLSPLPLDPTQSPPPIFNSRDHITKSPPIPGLPPPFLPPPLGATPFIPPPPLEGMMHPPLGDIGGMPPFIPGLHPPMFPGDHRPPPLGRMSSPPPVGGRYTPESTVYSEYDRYDRRSPSPPYDSEYGASPPPIRGYSPYDDRNRDRLRDGRREYKRPQPRSNGRHSKGIHSSGSENDSLGKVNKNSHRKV